MSLDLYNRKRKFEQTPEPKGKKVKHGSGDLRFVVQMHKATRLHWDLRLEFGGVFKSWAVPRGPSLNPMVQRLAVFVEDHPIEYGSFEGTIPKGNYGAGTVLLWDEGTYLERGSKNRTESELAVRKAFEKGHITFVLNGKKLQGEFALVKLKKGAEPKTWLLVKKRDEHSSYKRSEPFNDLSVKTGRNMEQIASGDSDVWKPEPKKKSATPKLKAPAPKHDPMPRKVKPMTAIPKKDSAGELENDDWIFEPQLDGLRAIAEVEGKKVHLYSRSGLPFEKKFPEIVEALRNQNLNAVLDGEILRAKTPVFHIFDILFSDGEDLRSRPLSERKQILAKLPISGRHLELIAEPKKNTSTLIAKRRGSLYVSGTSSEWLVVKSTTSAKKEKPAVDDGPRLTNLDKVYWPKENITKGDLLSYYENVSEFILPFIKDRPQSLNRQPNGVAAPGFYQKDLTGHIPRWLHTQRIFSESADKSIDYVLCQDLRSLLYIVNLGCIEINPWFSRVQSLEKPDFLVIDLDPDGNSFDQVIEIAHEVHDILDSIGAKNFCKTSGATGIHIAVPLGANFVFDDGRLFAEKICRYLAKRHPSSTSVERSPQRRRGKIYLDFLQNRRGQTLAAPFCVRPKPTAPVSMPLEWKDLKSGLRPEDFNIHNAPALMKSHLKSWSGVLGPGIDLSLCSSRFDKKFKL